MVDTALVSPGVGARVVPCPRQASYATAAVVPAGRLSFIYLLHPPSVHLTFIRPPMSARPPAPVPPSPPISQPGDPRRLSSTVAWLCAFFAFLNIYAMQPVLPMVMRDFGATPVQAGFTVGATILALALMSPFIGMLSDAAGRKSVVFFSLLGLCLPTALVPFADSLRMLIVLRFLQGLFIPGIVVVLLAYIGEEFAGEAIARLNGIFMSGAVMGGFCGRFITGHLGHLFGWRSAFIALTLLDALGALIVWRGIPASRHFTANRDFGNALRILARHLHNIPLLTACVVGFCVLFSLIGAFTYVVVLLGFPPFSLSVAALANIFSIYLIGAFITHFSGRFIARIGSRTALLIALAVSSGGLCLALLPSLFAVLAGLTLCSSAIFICQAAAFSAIAHNVSEGRSLASGLYYMAYYGGGATGAWVAGLAFEAYGWSGSVLSMILAQAVAAVAAWFGWRQATPTPSSRTPPEN